MRCVRCGLELPPGPYTRRDTCPGCAEAIHACVQCVFYAPGAYNDCREPQAERVLDKGAPNFCEYFRPNEAASPSGVDDRDAVRARLDALFKKS